MRTLRIYSLNFHVYHRATLTTSSCTLHPSSYLVTGSLYLLTTFIQFHLPSAPDSNNHKSDLFFFEFGFHFVFVFFS